MKLLSLVCSAGLIATIGCGGTHNVCAGGNGFCDQGDAAAQPDVVAPIDAGTTFDDACSFCSDAAYDAPTTTTPAGFYLLATETPYSPASNGSNWGGVEGFHITKDYQTATPGGGITKSSQPTLLADPLGLAFRWTTAELYVANRGGNLSGQSSITRFPYDSKTQTFGKGAVAVSGFTGFHQMAFNHTEDEIFVGTNNEGLRRYKLVNNAWVEQLPQLIGAPNWIRGVAVSPDGKRLYATSAHYDILQWDLTTNQQLSSYTLQDTTAALHFMTICGPAIANFTTGCSPAKLFVSDSTQSGARAVYEFDIDSVTNDLKNETKINANPTFDVALSPDTLEMFSGASSTNDIQRFEPLNKLWSPEPSSIATQNNIGTILIFPENAVPVTPN